MADIGKVEGLHSSPSSSSSSSSLAAPVSPKSPPGSRDLFGRRRQLVKVQVLEREISLLEVYFLIFMFHLTKHEMKPCYNVPHCVLCRVSSSLLIKPLSFMYVCVKICVLKLEIVRYLFKGKYSSSGDYTISIQGKKLHR